MNITVFGATGRIGREIVRQAVDGGHQVTAVVRDASRLTGIDPAVEVFELASLSDAERLRPAISGREAVLSGLGPRRRREAGVVTTLTSAITTAMRAESVERIVIVSAAPVGPIPPDEPFLTGRLGIPLLRRVLAAVYADLRQTEDELARQHLAWTSVRPPRLVDRPLSGSYRQVIDANPRAGSTIGRADVAHAMLATLTNPSTVEHAVGVAY